jgi:hypothetical protein
LLIHNPRRSEAEWGRRRAPDPLTFRAPRHHYDLPILSADEHPATDPRHDATGADLSAGAAPKPGSAPDAEARVAPLRGATVQIDRRRLTRVLVAIVVATLAVLVVVFTVVGIDKNHQIDQLHNQGVAVNVTITSCQGLLGGSGSNGAGYACRGTYGLDNRRYNEQLPGTALHAPGTVIRAVAVPGDPALVSPVSVVSAEHSSATVFILPAVLLVLLVAILIVVLLRRRGKSGDAEAGG